MNAPKLRGIGFLMELARLATRKKRLPVLVYHQVLSSPDSYRPMEPSLEQFAEQMDFVRQNFDVIALDTAVRQLHEGTLANNVISITFDDGYKNNLYNAARILSDLDMVATFFIATGYLNSGCMWNDTIIEGFRQTTMQLINLRGEGLEIFELTDDASRYRAARAIIRSAKYMEGDKRQIFVDKLVRNLDVDIKDRYMLTSDEVVQLDQIGMEIGAHTVSHPILLCQSPDRVVSELQESKCYLESLIGKEVRSFAYPNGRYGKDYDESIANLVSEAGFHCAVTTEPGVSHVGDDVFQIKRFTPWSKDIFKYSLQLARNTYL